MIYFYGLNPDIVNEKRILVIEDSFTSFLLIQHALKKEGFITVLASNINEAVHSIKESKPDIIVLDLNMPGLTGYDFLEMRDKLDIKSVPVIVVSALDSPESVARTKELGAYEFLAKPIKVEKFVEKIKSLQALPNK